jgi:hypothetical protein
VKNASDPQDYLIEMTSEILRCIQNGQTSDHVTIRSLAIRNIGVTALRMRLSVKRRVVVTLNVLAAGEGVPVRRVVLRFVLLSPVSALG